MPEIQVSEFERLMAEVADGSEDAVWKLAETYTPYILRIVREKLSPQLRRRVDSQDLAQILWASVLLRRSELTRLKTPGELIAFLGQAAKHRTLDARRRFLGTQKYDMDRELSLEQFTSDDEERLATKGYENRLLYSREPTPSQFASVREKWRHVLAQASERDRQIVELRLQGLTFQAVGEQMRITTRTAMRAVHQMIAQLSQ